MPNLKLLRGGYGTTDPASAASDMYNQLSSYISAQ